MQIQAQSNIYTGELISLDIKEADIHNVLRMLSDVSGLNIVAHGKVHATVTLRLKDVPWDQVFDIVLRIENLYMIRYGQVIIVYPVEEIR